MKNKKKSGMSLGIVVMFIMVMALIGVIMIAMSTSAFIQSTVLYRLDANYYSAEAALNRAVPGVVSYLIDGDSTSTAIALQDAAFQSLVRFSSTGSFSLSDLNLSDLEDWFIGDSQLGSEIMEIMHNYVVDTIGELPPLVDPATGIPASTVGLDYFWLVYGAGELGRNPTMAADGFGAPAFANIARAGSAFDSPINVGFDLGVEIVNIPSDFGWQVGHVHGFVVPYITFVSNSGGVALHQDVNLMRYAFSVPFDIFNPFPTTDGDDEPPPPPPPISWFPDSNAIIHGDRGGCGHDPGANPPVFCTFWPYPVAQGSFGPWTVRGQHMNQGQMQFFHQCCYLNLYRGNPFPLSHYTLRTAFPNATFDNHPYLPFRYAYDANGNRRNENSIPPHFINEKEAITRLLRNALDELWAARPVRSDLFPPSLPSAPGSTSGFVPDLGWVHVPPSAEHKEILFPDIVFTGNSHPVYGNLDYLGNWLRAIPSVQFLNITGRGHRDNLDGNINAPNLISVYSTSSITVNSGTNFTGLHGGATRFSITGSLNMNTIQAGIENANVINNVAFHASSMITVNNQNGAFLLGNATYIAYDGHISFNNNGITVGSVSVSPQFYALDHFQALPTGNFYGIFASRNPQLGGFNGNPIRITGFMMHNISNIHASNNTRFLPGNELLDTSGMMRDNAFLRRIEYLLGFSDTPDQPEIDVPPGDGEPTTTPTPPPGGGVGLPPTPPPPQFQPPPPPDEDDELYSRSTVGVRL